MSTRSLGRDPRNGLQFFAEAIGALVVLAAAKFASTYIPAAAGTPLRTLLDLLPVPGVWLLLFVILRHYRRIDEFQRLQFLKAVSLTGGIMAGIAWSWPSLHKAFGLVVADSGMWEVTFSILFVVITTVLARPPRAR
ncbi:MAG: hypothetical protein WDM86_11900 [Rhizomicrobium sp.]